MFRNSISAFVVVRLIGLKKGSCHSMEIRIFTTSCEIIVTMALFSTTGRWLRAAAYCISSEYSRVLDLIAGVPTGVILALSCGGGLAHI